MMSAWQPGVLPLAAEPGLYQPGLVGEDNGLDTVAEAELGQNPFQVRLDRRFLDEQAGGDFAVGQATGDEFQHIPLAGVRAASVGWPRGRARADGPCG